MTLDGIRKELEALRIEAHAEVRECKELINFDNVPEEIGIELDVVFESYTHDFDYLVKRFGAEIEHIERKRELLFKHLHKYMPKPKVEGPPKAALK